MKQSPWSLVLVLSAATCATAGAAEKAKAPSALNTLTAKEKADGWRLLFDGKTTQGWRGFKSDGFPAEHWVVDNGTLKCVGGKRVTDIVTVAEFDNFELTWEWNLSPGGNSGVKYLVDEEMSKSPHDGIGLEYQILDDDKHPDAKLGRDGNRTAGSLYDLIAADKRKKLHTPGEWNESRLVVDGNHVEHWLNGMKVVSYERGSSAMKALVAQSKYKSIPRFGDVAKGHLLLQDHETEVSYRNMKLRVLAKK